MNDTSKFVEDLYYKKICSLTGEQRLEIASNSFEAVKRVVISSLNDVKDDSEIKKQLFLRFYSEDLSGTQIKEFLQHIMS